MPAETEVNTGEYWRLRSSHIGGAFVALLVAVMLFAAWCAERDDARRGSIGEDCKPDGTCLGQLRCAQHFGISGYYHICEPTR